MLLVLKDVATTRSIWQPSVIFQASYVHYFEIDFLILQHFKKVSRRYEPGIMELRIAINLLLRVITWQFSLAFHIHNGWFVIRPV